jgi:hypothetical protein
VIATTPPTDDGRNVSLRGAGRDYWDQQIAWFRKESETSDPAPVARDVMERFEQFEAVMAGEEAPLITNVLLWNDEELGLGRWIEGAYYSFSRIAGTLLRRMAAASEALPPAGIATSMAALSLAASGTNIKWTQIADAGRRPQQMSEAHKVFAVTQEKGLAAAFVQVPFLGEVVSYTVPALYARVLLLNALCHGNLRRQQVAIIDCWLREWVSDYAVVRGPVAGAQLRAGPSSQAGLRTSGEGEVAQVLVIEPMASHIELVVRWLQEGRIFPGYGLAAALRVEEHVSVLDILRSFVAHSRAGIPPRQKREGRVADVEAFVGLPEVLGKSFAESDTAQDADTLMAPADMVGRQGGPGENPIDSAYEMKNRRLRLLDESPSGLGLEGDDTMDPLEAGTLIAIRSEPYAPAMLCEVVRRMPTPGAAARLGARVLTRDMRRVTLVAPQTQTKVETLFIPGEDSSGRGDTFLLSSSDFDPEAIFDLPLGDRTYRLRLNRICHRGRGWVLAKTEVLDAVSGSTR